MGRLRRWLGCVGGLALVACGDVRLEAGASSLSASWTDGPADSGGEEDDDDDGEVDGGDASDGDGTGAYKFDTPGAGDSADGTRGCRKADFLFVIDNSGSMGGEQANLAASFPGFAATMASTLEQVGNDYHVMVVDSDENPYQGCVDTCAAADMPSCNQYPDLCACFDEANSVTCTEVWGSPYGDTCDNTLGAGVVYPRGSGASMSSCGIAGGKRYTTKGQPDLEGTFACMATVGTSGDHDERPMAAMVAAVGPQAAAGGCNAGFIRDDAILVVTVISDAGTGSAAEAMAGDPQAWKDALVQAKNGNEGAVTVLVIMPDDDQPGGTCTAEPGWGPNPKLRQFAELFGDRGRLGSICEPDYTPFLEAAVETVIFDTCEEFEPEG